MTSKKDSNFSEKSSPNQTPKRGRGRPRKERPLESLRDNAELEKAKQIAALIQDEGMTPTSAAMALGVSWRGNGQVRDFVKQLLQEWSFTPEAMRGFVRAARMKVTAEALAVGDGDLALKGTNQIASDPEVGLNQPPATVINIDFQRVSHLTNFLDKDIEIPVIEVED